MSHAPRINLAAWGKVKRHAVEALSGAEERRCRLRSCSEMGRKKRPHGSGYATSSRPFLRRDVIGGAIIAEEGSSPPRSVTAAHQQSL